MPVTPNSDKLHVRSFYVTPRFAKPQLGLWLNESQADYILERPPGALTANHSPSNRYSYEPLGDFGS